MFARKLCALIAAAAMVIVSIAFGVAATAPATAQEPSPSGTPFPVTDVSPVILAPAAGTVTNDNQPLFSGTSSAESVTVSATDETSFCDATVVDGAWSCAPYSPVADGEYQVSAWTYWGDELFTSAYQALTIDTTPPALSTITGPAGELQTWTMVSTTDDATPVISGTGEPGATITLYRDYEIATCDGGAPTVDHLGTWACTLSDPLAHNVATMFGSIQTDAAGNVSTMGSPDPQLLLTLTDITAPDPAVITAPVDAAFSDVVYGTVNDATPTIEGTGEPGSALVLLVDEEEVSCGTIPQSGVWACELLAPLSDGSHSIDAILTDAATNTNSGAAQRLWLWVDTQVDPLVITEPEGTVDGDGVIHASTMSRHPVFSGYGEGGAIVHLYRGDIPVICEEGELVSGEGGFTCTVRPTLHPGVYQISGTQQDQAGNISPRQLLIELTIGDTANPSTHPQQPTPRQTSPNLPTLHLPGWSLHFSTNGTTLTPGQHVVISSTGLPPGAQVSVELHSTPILLGKTIVGSDGSFTLNSVIPTTIEPGEHHYVVTVTPKDRAASTVQQPVVVTAEPAPEPTEDGEDDTPAAAPSGTAGSGNAGTATDWSHRSDPAGVTSLSNALPTVQQLLANPVTVGMAAAGSVALLLFVAFPAELLNTTLAEQYDRLFGKVRKVRLGWLETLRARLARTPLLGGILVTAVVAVIFSFADPGFGWNLASLRLVLACGIALFDVGYLASTITGRLLTSRWHLTTRIEIQPLAVLLALAGVLVSRVLEFSPGFLIGLVLGVAITSTTTPRQRATATLLTAGTILAAGILAWIGYSILIGINGGTPTSFIEALAQDTLVAIPTEGITALLIALLPFRYLEGENIYTQSKKLWAASYLTTLLAFCLIVLPQAANWGDLGPAIGIWAIIAAAFTTFSITIYLYFQHHDKKTDTAKVEPEAELLSVEH